MTTTPTSNLTGREPRLTHKKGHYRLSLRGLGTMLNVLPPEAISLDAAEAALRNKDFYVRYNAARVLRRRGDRNARVIMEDALIHGDAPTRASVARELYGFSWFSAEPLLRRAMKDEDVRVHETAVYALCDLRELRGFQLLVEMLPDEPDNVKAAAAWGLHNCQDPEAVPVLQVALTAHDADVRVKTLEALGANDTPEALPVVRAALDDSHPDVKYAAVLSLIELQGEEGFGEVAQLIEDTIGITRQQILRGFFHATNYLAINVAKTPAVDAILNALEKALLDLMAEARLAAIWPLAWIRHPRAPHILKHAYANEHDSEVKAQTVKIAYNLMSEVREELLADAAQSGDEKVKEAAEQIRILRGGPADRVRR
jgi:HEAT repeat protein